MHIHPIAARSQIDLADFVPVDPVMVLWGESVVSDSLADPVPSGGPIVRWLHRYRVSGATLAKLDATAFVVGADHVAETRRIRGTAGINEHPSPIRLPRDLRRQVWHAALGSDHHGRVALGWAGLAEVAVGGRSERLEVACLVAREGGEGRAQWLAAGVGEFALGDASGIARHAVGVICGEIPLWGGVPDAVASMPRPDFTSEGGALGVPSLW